MSLHSHLLNEKLFYLWLLSVYLKICLSVSVLVFCLLILPTYSWTSCWGYTTKIKLTFLCCGKVLQMVVDWSYHRKTYNLPSLQLEVSCQLLQTYRLTDLSFIMVVYGENACWTKGRLFCCCGWLLTQVGRKSPCWNHIQLFNTSMCSTNKATAFMWHVLCV